MTAIEWTDETWNPVIGCSKVSPGCANCYAETVHQARLSGQGAYPEFKPWTPENAEHNVRMVPARLDKPLRWSKPRMVFVNSMSDLFHELVTDDYIAQVFAVMGLARWHTFQVLTKRPERMRDLLSTLDFWRAVSGYCVSLQNVGGNQRMMAGAFTFSGWDGRSSVPENVWLGTSIENRTWIRRADELRATPAAVRFISAEPLLGPLTVARTPREDPERYPRDYKEALSLWGIDWLIVGGESGGPDRRQLTEMKADWVRDLRDDCVRGEMGVRRTAFFFKQWGGRTSKAGGRELDGRTWDEYPVRGNR